MMKPVHFVTVTSGNQTPIPTDRYVNGFALAVSMKNAGIVYTLQYTLSDLTYDAVATFNARTPTKYTNSVAVSGVWFNWDDATLVNASTNKSTNLSFTPTAVRVSVSAKISAGNPLVLDIVPNGMDGN